MYMLLQIDAKTDDGLISGTHVQWCCGCTLEQADQRARDTERTNGNKIEIAVVNELYEPYCLGKRYADMKRLDV